MTNHKDQLADIATTFGQTLLQVGSLPFYSFGQNFPTMILLSFNRIFPFLCCFCRIKCRLLCMRTVFKFYYNYAVIPAVSFCFLAFSVAFFGNMTTDLRLLFGSGLAALQDENQDMKRKPWHASQCQDQSQGHMAVQTSQARPGIHQSVKIIHEAVWQYRHRLVHSARLKGTWQHQFAMSSVSAQRIRSSLLPPIPASAAPAEFGKWSLCRGAMPL